jgi:hypothetical protein
MVISEHDVSVGIAKVYGLDGWVSIPGGGKIFLFSTASRPAVGPTTLLSSGYRVWRGPGHEANHSPPSSAEAKNSGAIPTLLHVFMAWSSEAQGQVSLCNRSLQLWLL